MAVINEVGLQIQSLAAHHRFVVSDVDLLGCSVGGQFGRLEFDAVLGSGRLLLLGLYQLTAEHRFVAQFWSIDDHDGGCAKSAPAPLAPRHRVWTYDASTDSKVLALEIIRAVAGWLDQTG